MENKDAIIKELIDENQQLREVIRLLKDKIARFGKNSNNSSKPPSSDIVKPTRTVLKVRRKKRKRGGQFGHRARKYLDPITGQIHIAPMPDEIRKGSLLGARFTTMIAFLKSGCHGSYGTIRQFCKEIYGIKQGFLRQVRRPPDHKLARKLKKRFRGKLANNYFVFLTDPNVEPTNNSTERAIRYLVIDRLVTQGTRSQNGMRWCERAWTIVATCKKQSRNVFDFIHEAVIAHWTKQQCPTLPC